MATFWSDSQASPKLSYRWVATIGGPNPIQIHTLLSFQKPSFEVHVSEYININDVAYKPGMLTWNPIEIVLVDAETVEENNTRQVYKKIQQSGYKRAGGKPMSAIIKSKGSAALGGRIYFQQIYADEHSRQSPKETKTLETWKLVNPFITKVDFGRGTYGTEEIMTVNMTIRYDDAIYKLS